MSRFQIFTAAALICAAASPALAQVDTPYVLAVTAHFFNCNETIAVGDSQSTADACLVAAQGIEQLQVENGGASAAEHDTAWYFRAVVQLAMGTAYVQLDDALSPRACERAERAWQSMGNIGPAFPEPDILVSSSASAAEAVGACRQVQPAPDWARALP